MKHILPKLALLGVAAFLAAACNKNTGEGTNVALKRQFDAWRAIHYPAAVEKDGIYIIEDTPGTGPAWDKNLSITFMTYTMRSLDGTVSYNTDEQWAKQLGEWDQTYYYGAQVVPTGKDATYAGLDILLEGMRQGGTRTAIIPSWMMTYDRYDSLSKYLEKSTDTPSMIYTVTFLDQTDNLSEHKKYYNKRNIEVVSYEVIETDETAAYDYDRGTDWEDNGEGDWTSTYRMAAYFQNIPSRKIFEALDDESQANLAERLAVEWHTYLDYYTMKLTLTQTGNTVNYDLSKSGIVGSGHAYGYMKLKYREQ